MNEKEFIEIVSDINTLQLASTYETVIEGEMSMKIRALGVLTRFYLEVGRHGQS